MDDLKLDYSIECGECGMIASAVLDITNEAAARKDFETDGWKVVDGENRCATCAED